MLRSILTINDPGDPASSIQLNYCLSGHVATPHKDNVVHLLARDNRWTHMKQYRSIFSSTLTHVYADETSVDTPDCSGMTALECSIRTGNFQAFSALLDRGASLERLGQDRKTPLQQALDHCSDIQIIAELLRRSGKQRLPFEPVQDEDSALLNDQAMCNLYVIVSSSNDSLQFRDAYCVIEALILYTSRGKRHKLSMNSILSMLLETFNHRDRSSRSVEASSFTVETEPWICVYLRILFRSQSKLSSFNSTYWNGRSGRRCSCANAAAFAIFHVCDAQIFETILDCSSKDDAKFFVQLVVTPCLVRDQSCNTTYLSKILSRLRKFLGSGQLKLYDTLAAILDQTPDEMKASFWKSLVISEPVYILSAGADGCTSLAKRLTSVTGPSRWELAELLLPHDPGFRFSCEDPLTFTLLRPRTAAKDPLYYASHDFLEYLCHWTNSVCKAKGSIHLRATLSCDCLASIEREADSTSNAPRQTQRRSQRAKTMQKLALHVVTKDLCQRRSHFAPAEVLKNRIQLALRLRSDFSLPGLSIDSELLLQALKGDGGSSCTENEVVDIVPPPTRTKRPVQRAETPRAIDDMAALEPSP